MKKIIITVLSLFILTNISVAQELKLGVKAGLNFSKIKSNEGWFASDTKAGYQAGLWARVGIANIYVQPEAYFTSKKATIHPKIQNAPSDLINGDIKFTNIDVPLLIGTKFPIGSIHAKLQAGPLFSFVVNQNNPYLDSASEAYDDALNNYKDRFSAIVIGTGFDIFSFALDLRYEHGLGNITKSATEKQTMNLWTVSLGYSFL